MICDLFLFSISVYSFLLFMSSFTFDCFIIIFYSSSSSFSSNNFRFVMFFSIFNNSFLSQLVLSTSEICCKISEKDNYYSYYIVKSGKFQQVLENCKTTDNLYMYKHLFCILCFFLFSRCTITLKPSQYSKNTFV